MKNSDKIIIGAIVFLVGIQLIYYDWKYLISIAIGYSIGYLIINFAQMFDKPSQTKE